MVAIGIGIALISLGLFEDNLLGQDAQNYIPGSTIWFQIAGATILSGGLLVLARAVSE
jgi:hypothetical protein